MKQQITTDIEFDEMPLYDSRYICAIARNNECGTTSRYWRGVVCINNIWVLEDGEMVIGWLALPEF